MSDEAMAEHRALLKEQQTNRVLSDIRMVEVGIAIPKDILVSRWLADRAITPKHLQAARRQVAQDYHPDHGGNGALMQLANSAIDEAITELEALAEADNRRREVAHV